MEKLISVKEAANKLSMHYETLRLIIKRNSKIGGVYKVGKVYKLDLDLFKQNLASKDKLPLKTSFNQLRGYYEQQSGYLLTVSEKTKRTHIRALNLAGQFFFNKEFNEPNLFQFRSWLMVNNNIKESTTKKYLDVISKMCATCEQVGLVEHIKRDYLKGLKKHVNTRFLTKEERERLRATANKNVLDYIEFAIETGLRKDEMFNLKWEHVYFDDKKIFIAKRKCGDSLTLRISEAAWQILNSRKHLSQPFVAIRHETYQKALDNAGIEKVINGKVCTFHTLRHTFASWALMGWHTWQKGKPMSVYDIKRLLGHSKIATTEKYLHLDTNEIDRIFELET